MIRLKYIYIYSNIPINECPLLSDSSFAPIIASRFAIARMETRAPVSRPEPAKWEEEGGELISGRLFSVLAFVITRLVNGDPLWSRGITENKPSFEAEIWIRWRFLQGNEVGDWRGGMVFVRVPGFDIAL